jgi:hypothetical protein
MRNRILICSKCPQRERPCNGQCECKADPQKRSSYQLAVLGACPLGNFGEGAKPTDPEKAGVARLLHGAVGIAKAVLHIDRADDATIDRRRAICGTCDQATVVLGVLEKCKACGCGIVPKTANADQVCPLGKW